MVMDIGPEPSTLPDTELVHAKREKLKTEVGEIQALGHVVDVPTRGLSRKPLPWRSSLRVPLGSFHLRPTCPPNPRGASYHRPVPQFALELGRGR